MRSRVLRPSYRYWGTGLVLALLALISLVVLEPNSTASLPAGPGAAAAAPVGPELAGASVEPSTGPEPPAAPAGPAPPGLVAPAGPPGPPGPVGLSEPGGRAGPAQLPPVAEQGLPAPPVSAELISRTARPDRVVALTFDDGPDPVYTPQLLELLTRHHAVATFCMVGSEAVRHPEIVRQVVAAGMHLCGHTVTHDQHLRLRPESQIEAEIVNGRNDILAAAGVAVAVNYFRAPAGRWSDAIQRIAADNGMKPLSWSVDTRDWTSPGVAQIVATVKEQVQPGAVILLHDGGGPQGQTVAAVAELLPWLIAQNYQFDVPA